MGFFTRVFKRRSDPTRDWPIATGQCPQVSLDRQALESFGGRIKFGEGLDAARFLGRPDVFDGPGAAGCTLTYTEWASNSSSR